MYELLQASRDVTACICGPTSRGQTWAEQVKTADGVAPRFRFSSRRTKLLGTAGLAGPDGAAGEKL